MKEGIHPDYKPTTITCACGEVIETSSTKEDIRVEICSKCPPPPPGPPPPAATGGRAEKPKKRTGLKKFAIA